MKESKHLNFIKPYIMIGRKLVYDNPNGKFLYEHWGGRNPFGKDVDKLTEFIDNYSFDELKKYVEENIDEICNELDTRWLLSLCELYVDLSQVIKDKSDALVIITFITNGNMGLKSDQEPGRRNSQLSFSKDTGAPEKYCCQSLEGFFV